MQHPHLYKVLDTAQGLISNPDNWGKGARAIDVDGVRVSPTSEKAVCFCMIGAIQRAEIIVGSFHLSDAITFMQSMVPHGSIAGFNDQPYRTHEDVMDMFRVAKAAAESLD